MRKDCNDAVGELSTQEMIELIRNAPPGPWPPGWAGWDNVRDAHIALMDDHIANTPKYPAGKYEGRGIVVSVNAKPGHSSGKNLPQGYFPGAWVLVQELRRLGCTLPITFAYLGDLEWDPTLTRLMTPLGVDCLDLRKVEAADPTPPRILAGWESKPYSVLQSRYREVLYLDADNIPMHDPTFLFNCQQFRCHGAIFWKDLPPYDRPEWTPDVVWKNCGMPFIDTPAFESGQFIVDKEKCWKELNLTMWINAHSEYWYQMVFGDKDTFLLAWQKIHHVESDRSGTLRYCMPFRGPGGNQASLFQHDFKGDILFQHCTRNKPSLAGYPSPGALRRSEVCQGHLAELRSLWCGQLWMNKNPTVQEQEWAVALEGKRFTYERLGLDSREFRLLEDNRIGRGLAKLEVGWSVFGEDSRPVLAITSLDGVPTVILREQPGGVWSGTWLEHERCQVRLIPKE